MLLLILLLLLLLFEGLRTDKSEHNIEVGISVQVGVILGEVKIIII